MGGRLDFGVGKGYRHNEFASFRIPMEEGQARFEEAIDIITKSWVSNERFDFKGQYWAFDDIVVEPPTIQRPHPPFWQGAGHPESIRRVAARGHNLLLDQFASIDDLGIEEFFEIPRLAGRKIVVEDDHVSIGGLEQLMQFLQFALADVSARNDGFAFLEKVAHHDRTGCGRQAAQLIQGIRS